MWRVVVLTGATVLTVGPWKALQPERTGGSRLARQGHREAARSGLEALGRGG
jgi:hypothetical protein